MGRGFNLRFGEIFRQSPPSFTLQTDTQVPLVVENPKSTALSKLKKEVYNPTPKRLAGRLSLYYRDNAVNALKEREKEKSKTVGISQDKSRKLREEASLRERYEQWMAEYGKVYKDAAEKEKHFLIFKDNVECIESFNAAGNKPYKLGINHLADLTSEEYNAYLNGCLRCKEGLCGIAEYTSNPTA